jgi:hypothetical protein
MIEFKILACPDKSQQSTYRHPGSSLTFGSGEADMLIDDPAIAASQVRIFFQGGGFFLENLEPEVEVRLNGKTLDGPSPLKERDHITLGRTTVNFVALDPQPLRAPPPYEHPHTATRVVEGSKEKAILDVLGHLAQPAAPAAMPKPPLPGGPKPPLPGAKPPPPPSGMPPLPPKRN